jgi:hypothetical protein
MELAKLQFLIAAILVLSGELSAQQRECTLQKDTLTDERFLLVPDTQATPVGGLPALFKEIGKSLKLPDTDDVSRYTKLVVAFIVDQNGQVKGERILDQTPTDAADQVFIAVKKLTWKPAMCAGKPVGSLYLLPIRLHPER